MKVIESHQCDLIRLRIDFMRPFKATNTAEFTFKNDSNQTIVTLTMSGENNFIAKAMQIFVNYDKMIGADFEKGLAAMKSVVETAQS